MDNEYLKRIYGLLESGATLGTGAVSGLVGLPYGLYKGVTSGAYGTPEAPRIAAREAQQFMERNTYQPRTAEGQENLRQLAGLLEATKLPPVMPEASLLAAIPKQAYAAQAERAGMAAEKAIAPVVTRTMERGGMPAQLLQDLSQGSIRPMDVWHGSPHGPFERFDPTKIGSGEGAQAFSYGHYLGESRGTGEEYARILSNRDIANEGRLNAHANAQRLANLAGDAKYAADDIKFVLENQPDHPQKKLLSETLQFLESGDYAKPLESKGYLYKVDLPDEAIANMLDWDKPYNKQPKQVQDALKNSNVAEIWKAQYGFDIEKNQPQMDMVYKAVAEQLGSPAAASQYFKDLGILGTRYLDEGSRAAGKGTSNFVVFPGGEDLLTIKEINDKPVGGLLGQSKAAEATDLLSYRGSHSAPNVNVYGATLDDLTKIMPADVYESRGKQLYGIGNPMIDSQWRIAALKARGKPDADIEIYRAVPKGVDSINSGDWVTTSQEYAKWHGENVLNGDFDIIKKKVKAKTLSTEGYPYEFGYNQE